MTFANFDLRLETALTENNQSCAFTTKALSVVLGVPQQTLNGYFKRLGTTGQDPRKTLNEAQALGLKTTGSEHPNGLYVFLEQVVEVINWGAQKYEKALQFL